MCSATVARLRGNGVLGGPILGSGPREVADPDVVAADRTHILLRCVQMAAVAGDQVIGPGIDHPAPTGMLNPDRMRRNRVCDTNQGRSVMEIQLGSGAPR